MTRADAATISRQDSDAALRCALQGPLEGQLNLACDLLTRVAVGHDAPLTRTSQFSACAALRLSISHRFPLARFDYLGNEAFVTFSAEYQMRIRRREGRVARLTSSRLAG